jgi:hypothetical protein
MPGNRLFPILLLALWFAGSPVYAQCQLPPADSVPGVDGEIATYEEMKTVQLAVKAYVEQGETYLLCLRDSLGRGYKSRTLHNAALDQMELVSARFNRELRKFKRQQQIEPGSAL